MAGSPAPRPAAGTPHSSGPRWFYRLIRKPLRGVFGNVLTVPRGFLDFGKGFGQRFAHFQRNRACQLFPLLAQQYCGRLQDGGAIVYGQVSPGARCDLGGVEQRLNHGFAVWRWRRRLLPVAGLERAEGDNILETVSLECRLVDGSGIAPCYLADIALQKSCHGHRAIGHPVQRVGGYAVVRAGAAESGSRGPSIRSSAVRDVRSRQCWSPPELPAPLQCPHTGLRPRSD